ncbi:MAG: hypothetical protein JSW58_05115 [Candidatus Latescibacterota bacterium]|nr:MAG: hypothetical protein JSW58_05115 [Candidatus Latescibacterota bacterium]
MLRKAGIVLPVTFFVAVCGVIVLRFQMPLGPAALILSVVPLLVVRASGRAISATVPDIVFGSIDTGLLAILAVWGAAVFGVAGAIAGGVVGDALTDSVAGFFEGHIAEWLRSHGFEESREAVTTALGKMSGCLLGSGAVLSVAALAGFQLTFA